MTKTQSIKAAIQAIHSTFEEAEHQLSQLGEGLQFLIGPEGEVEIVRRGKAGETVRPKTVFARLKGCDPVLWRADHPTWLLALGPDQDRVEAVQEGTSPDAAPQQTQDRAKPGDDAPRNPARRDGEPSAEEI